MRDPSSSSPWLSTIRRPLLCVRPRASEGRPSVMIKYNLPLRAAGPTILLSLLLLSLCIAAAAYLYSQQASSAEVLNEDVSSNQVAHDLENTVDNLVRLLRDRNEHVDTLHEH